MLFERYKFGEHCHAVKRYLLLGQGDFHAFLMDLVGPDLAEPAGAVSAYRLTGTLEAAIRSSNAQFDDADVLDRLRVRMMPHVGGDELGWDVFSLEYVFAPPLTTIFTENAMGKYLRVFNFLWRLKRVEHSLCATWETMKPNVTAALQRDGVAGAAGRALAGNSEDATPFAARCTTSSPTFSTTSCSRCSRVPGRCSRARWTRRAISTRSWRRTIGTSTPFSRRASSDPSRSSCRTPCRVCSR